MQMIFLKNITLLVWKLNVRMDTTMNCTFEALHLFVQHPMILRTWLSQSLAPLWYHLFETTNLQIPLIWWYDIIYLNINPHGFTFGLISSKKSIIGVSCPPLYTHVHLQHTNIINHNLQFDIDAINNGKPLDLFFCVHITLMHSINVKNIL